MGVFNHQPVYNSSPCHDLGVKQVAYQAKNEFHPNLVIF